MGLHEEPVGSGGAGRQREGRDELPSPARRPTDALPWTLHRVRGVEDHRGRTGLTHPREAPHIDHEVTIAEEGASLGHRDRRPRRSRRAHLRDRADHPFRVHPLPLLHVHGLPRRPCRLEEVGLSAEEGRDLEDVGHLCRGGALLREMHIGEDRETGARSYAIERGEPFLQPRTTRRADVRAIRLVEARLEDDPAGHPLREAREMLPHAEHQLVMLDDAGSRDQEELARG